MTMTFPLAETPDAALREKGRLLFAQQTDFLKGVVAIDGLPADDRIEICFAGRSNVGKSTLINALTGRKALARTSNTPGRTQEINFFTAADSHYLKKYLSGRRSLRRAFVLIDARHGVKSVDEEILSLLDSAAVTFQCVLTKADKIKTHEQEALLQQVRGALSKHPAAYPELILTSSEKGMGVETLRATIAGLI